MCILEKTTTKTTPTAKNLPPEYHHSPAQFEVARLELNVIFRNDISQQCATLLYPFHGIEIRCTTFQLNTKSGGKQMPIYV